MPSLKKLAVFYAAIFLPIAAISILRRTGIADSQIFVILLSIYAFIYHPIMSGLRLVSIGAIRKSEFVWNFLPGWNLKFWNLLFLNRAE